MSRLETIEEGKGKDIKELLYFEIVMLFAVQGGILSEGVRVPEQIGDFEANEALPGKGLLYEVCLGQLPRVAGHSDDSRDIPGRMGIIDYA